MQEELVTVSTACDHQVNVLQSAKTRLEQDVSGSNVVEEENHRLRARFEELLLKMEADGQNHVEQTALAKKEAFSLRMQLESTFRRSLHEMDEKYRDMAFAAMDDESRHALLANSKLKEELAMQSVGITSLTARYNAAVSSLTSLRVEHDVLKQSAGLHAEQMASMKRQLHERDDQNRELRLEIASLQEQIAAGAGGVGGASTAEAARAAERERDELRLSLRTAKARSEKWKARAFSLTAALAATSLERGPASPATSAFGGGGSSSLPVFLSAAAVTAASAAAVSEPPFAAAETASLEVRLAEREAAEALSAVGAAQRGDARQRGGGATPQQSFSEFLAIWSTSHGGNLLHQGARSNQLLVPASAPSSPSGARNLFAASSPAATGKQSRAASGSVRLLGLEPVGVGLGTRAFASAASAARAATARSGSAGAAFRSGRSAHAAQRSVPLFP